jgi:bifunctional UDP-N-acetylglucosamine pyrophosphorylase/glucosamine-1-phosphate N-acetyltransferase
MKKYVVILAAGKGTRMYSKKPKVMHEIIGKSMIKYILDATRNAGFKTATVIGGYNYELLKNHLSDLKNVNLVEQKEQLGTGHAIMQTQNMFANKAGAVLVLAGDMPLIKPETIREMFKEHEKSNNDVTILTATKNNPTGYGRIIRRNKNVVGIVEEKDCTFEQRKISEINTSVYIFDCEKLFKQTKFLTNDNAQQEYYLTDMVKIFDSKKYRIGSYTVNNDIETEGVNDRPTINKLTNILKEEINAELVASGVTILSQDVFIGPDVQIENDVEILGSCIITGNTQIKSGTKILGDSIIKDSLIESDCFLDSVRLSDSKIGQNTKLGAFCTIRNNCEIGKNNEIGNFVEFKNTITGKNVKAKHHSYIGDAVVGNDVNFGCGSITANYDGKNKHQTIVGNKAFIGTNASIIAPANIGDNVVVAAGSTVNGDMPKNSLVLARSKQVIKENYYEDKKESVKK